MANLSLVRAKCIAFMLKGVPFKEAWFLLGLYSASIGLEMVRRFCRGPAIPVDLISLTLTAQPERLPTPMQYNRSCKKKKNAHLEGSRRHQVRGPDCFSC